MHKNNIKIIVSLTLLINYTSTDTMMFKHLKDKPSTKKYTFTRIQQQTDPVNMAQNSDSNLEEEDTVDYRELAKNAFYTGLTHIAHQSSD